MARWNKTCNEFKEVREMISNDGSNRDILDRLVKICAKYSKQNWGFAEDFDDLGMEIDCALKDGEYDDDDSVNYYLGEFYDLCDNARVWLGI